MKQNVDGAWNGVAQLQSHDDDDDDGDDDEGGEEDDGDSQTQNHPHQKCFGAVHQKHCFEYIF